MSDFHFQVVGPAGTFVLTAGSAGSLKSTVRCHGHQFLSGPASLPLPVKEPDTTWEAKGKGFTSAGVHASSLVSLAPCRRKFEGALRAEALHAARPCWCQPAARTQESCRRLLDSARPTISPKTARLWNLGQENEPASNQVGPAGLREADPPHGGGAASGRRGRSHILLRLLTDRAWTSEFIRK